MKPFTLKQFTTNTNMATFSAMFQALVVITTFTSVGCYETVYDSTTIAPSWSKGVSFMMYGVAISDTHLVIGAGQEIVNGVDSAGSVYIYTREAGSLMPNLPPVKVVPNESTTRGFGNVVALNKDFIVVSTRHQGTAVSGIFVVTVGGVHVQKLPFPDSMPNSMAFGQSVGINSDNEIAVGAFEHSNGHSKIFIFRYDGSSWSQFQTLPMDFYCARLGLIVGITADHIIAPCKGESNEERNGIYVFNKNESNVWVNQQFLPPRRGIPGYTWETVGSYAGGFPYFAAIQGHRIIATEYHQYAYVYDLINNTWTPTGILDGKLRDSFGEFLAFDGNVALVGAPRTAPTKTGAFYLFELNKTLDTWEEIGSLTFNGIGVNNYFGYGGVIKDGLVYTVPRADAPSSCTDCGCKVFNLTGIVTPSEPPQIPTTESPQPSTNDSDTSSYTSAMDAMCLQDSFTVTWSKSSFDGATSFNVTLNDNHCNVFWENNTNFGISSNLTECGSGGVSEQEDYLIHNNLIVLKVSYGNSAVINREKTVSYNVACQTYRHVNITSINDFNATSSGSVAVDVMKESQLEASMNIFTTSTYISVATDPYNVGTGQPLYVSVDAPSELYSFVVNDCYATPSSEPDDVLYSFFRNKCPLDTTFRVLPSLQNQFRYKIDAFQFIAVTKSILLHCRLFLCPKSSTSADCQQECASSRSRREVGIVAERSAIIDIKSQEIVYKRMYLVFLIILLVKKLAKSN